MPTKDTASPIQQFIDVDSIENDTIRLKSGALRKILLVSGINFELKSEEEQGMIIYAFQNFLNSINFSIQFFIHSRKLNIDSYLAKLATRAEEEPTELLKQQIGEYKEFVRVFVAENAIMEKNFFLVIPYDPIQIAKSSKNILSTITGIFKKEKVAPQPSVETVPPEQYEQLDLRVEQAVAGLNQIGLRAIPLNGEELKELLYNLYNPTAIEKKEAEIKK